MIPLTGIYEEGFTADQALFNYSVSADTDGSTMSLAVTDNVPGMHPAYFVLHQGQVLLTAAGANYFNTLEASDVLSVRVTVTATDDAGLVNESQASASSTLQGTIVSPELPPALTRQAIAQTGLVEEGFSAGQALFRPMPRISRWIRSTRRWC